jgi:UDP-N-acetylmuramyl pentapeptide synthase
MTDKIHMSDTATLSFDMIAAAHLSIITGELNLQSKMLACLVIDQLGELPDEIKDAVEQRDQMAMRMTEVMQEVKASIKGVDT